MPGLGIPSQWDGVLLGLGDLHPPRNVDVASALPRWLPFSLSLPCPLFIFFPVFCPLVSVVIKWVDGLRDRYGVTIVTVRDREWRLSSWREYEMNRAGTLQVPSVSRRLLGVFGALLTVGEDVSLTL